MLGHQGGAPDKLWLAKGDKAVKPGLKRGEFGGNVTFPAQIALFEPQRVHGIHAKRPEAERLARTGKRVMHRHHVFHGDVQLIAKLADIADPQRRHARHANLD